MFKSIRSSAPMVAALVLCLAAGCSKDKDVTGGELTSTDGILRFVPADTPYILASGAPLPDDLLDKLEPRVDELLDSYQQVLREIARREIAENEAGMDAEEIGRMTAFADELISLFSIERMRAAGITRDSRFVVYGNGLLPVIRLELSDEALFERQIARIEASAGKTMNTAEIDGRSFRYLGDDEARMIIALLDGNAVVTFAPTEFGDDELRTLLGITPPKQNIAASGRLQELVTEFGFKEHYLGFLDNLELASTFIDGPTGLDAALFAVEDQEPLSDVCRDEIRDAVGVVPRIVLGYDEVSAAAMKGRMIVEVRDDLAAEMKALPAQVPGLGTDPGGLLSFGVSFNLQAVRDFMEARIDAVEADPFECEHFAELQAGMIGGRAALNQPVPPFVYGLRGLNIVIDDADDLDFGSGRPPRNVDATVLLAMDDAPAMVGMGAMFSPDLAALNLQPDGVPVRLDLPQVQMVASEAFAALNGNALAVAIGDGAESRASSALVAEGANPPPFLSLAMDAGTYYELLAEDTMNAPVDGEMALSEESRKAIADSMRSIAEMYDRMSFDIRFTDRGVEIASQVTLSD